jgi:hypothetical protein
MGCSKKNANDFYHLHQKRCELLLLSLKFKKMYDGLTITAYLLFLIVMIIVAVISFSKDDNSLTH